MALSNDSIIGIVLIILIIIIIIIVIMVMMTNPGNGHDILPPSDSSSGSKNVVVPVVKPIGIPPVRPCVKPCGCHCQRNCQCAVLYNKPAMVVHHDSNSSSSSSSSNSSVLPICDAESIRKGYSCTPSSSDVSSSDVHSISSESISPDAHVAKITFDRKPCPDSKSSSSSSSSSSSGVSAFSVSTDSSESKQCRGALGQTEFQLPATPQLNCVTLQDGQFKSVCGLVAGGQYFVQWYPVATSQPLIKYTVYAKHGVKEGDTARDVKFDVSPDSHYFLIPSMEAGPWSFSVTATVSSFDGGEVESAPSEVFEAK